MAKGLTEKQRKILEFIIDFQKDHGFPPTIRELGDAFEIGSLRGVTVHLDALVRKGYMTRERTSRSLRVISPDPREPVGGAKPETSVRLPLVRTSGAGDFLSGKITSEGQIERHLSVPEELAFPATENGFVIRVGGSGVYGEPILPGDLLVVRPQRTVAAGELAVTFSHGDMVVSRATAAIHSAVPAGSVHSSTGSGGGTAVAEMETAVGGSGGGDTEVLGRVVGLIRRY